MLLLLLAYNWLSAVVAWLEAAVPNDVDEEAVTTALPAPLVSNDDVDNEVAEADFDTEVAEATEDVDDVDFHDVDITFFTFHCHT